MRLSLVLILIVSVGLCGCVGYQSVTKMERVDGKMIEVYKVKGLIVGTSGQKIADKDLAIEKKDTSDVVAGLLEDGIAAGMSAAKGGLIK